MQTRKNRLFAFLGVFLMASAIGLFVWYEWGGGRELVHYQDVYVFSDDVNKGQKISDELLETVKIEKSLLMKNAIQDKTKIVGKEARHFIPASTQLHPDYFDESGLVLKDGQYVAQIPLEWTLAIPDSLRRGDEVIVYAAQYDKQLLRSLLPNRQDLHGNTQASSEEKKTGNNQAESVEKNEVLTEEEGTTADNSTNQIEELLKTKVAFVKDSANREVVTVSTSDRLDGSSVIRNVEIITTPEEFKMIENEINKGSKLIIMYTEKEKEPKK